MDDPLDDYPDPGTQTLPELPDLEQGPDNDGNNSAEENEAPVPVDLGKLARLVKLDFLKTSLAFIEATRAATLDDQYSRLDDAALQ